VSDVVADLRAYYEEEAKQRRRPSQRENRITLRNKFLALLRDESRETVADFGAGPGDDGSGFVEAGHRYVGLDLAHGNGVLAASAGITVVQGSIAAPPFRSASFDAGWSMSTLMHIPEQEVPAVLAAMVDVVRPGAPFLLAQWGAAAGEEPRDIIHQGDLAGQQRLFSLRTVDRNRELVSAVADIEQEDVWPVGEPGWAYHVFVLRVRHSEAP